MGSSLSPSPTPRLRSKPPNVVVHPLSGVEMQPLAPSALGSAPGSGFRLTEGCGALGRGALRDQMVVIRTVPRAHFGPYL